MQDVMREVYEFVKNSHEMARFAPALMHLYVREAGVLGELVTERNGVVRYVPGVLAVHTYPVFLQPFVRWKHDQTDLAQARAIMMTFLLGTTVLKMRDQDHRLVEVPAIKVRPRWRYTDWDLEEGNIWRTARVTWNTEALVWKQRVPVVSIRTLVARWWLGDRGSPKSGFLLDPKNFGGAVCITFDMDFDLCLVLTTNPDDALPNPAVSVPGFSVPEKPPLSNSTVTTINLRFQITSSTTQPETSDEGGES